MKLSPLSALFTSCLSLNVFASASYHPSWQSDRQMQNVSGSANPAALGEVAKKASSSKMAFTGSAFLEYGNLDDLFELYNRLAKSNSPSDPPVGTPVQPIEPGPSFGDIDWQKVFEQYPGLEERVNALSAAAVNYSSLLALIASEGYGKAEAHLELPVLLNTPMLGGYVSFSASYAGFTRANGILEQINFNAAYAKEQLATIADLTPDDGLQIIDLSGGLTLFYNPSNKRTKLTVKNDSVLLVKAAKIQKISLTYSRPFQLSNDSTWYLGLRPNIYNVGMANNSVRIGDLDDSEALFKDIKNGDYRWQTGVDFDLGVHLTAPNFSAGIYLKNALQSSFDFPEIDRRRYQSQYVLQQLNHHEKIKFEQQVSVNTNYQLANWMFDANYDVNATTDPMRDRNQWFSIRASHIQNAHWLPATRFGFYKNLAGSKLSYVSIGATVFDVVTLDVASTLDSVEIEGSTLMRGFNAAIGVQFRF